jgi:hypothetical protein
MNAETWPTTTDAVAMLEYLFGMRSPDSVLPDQRPVWLYLHTCARRAWDRLPWVMRALVEVAELLPDRHPVDARLKSAAVTAAEEMYQNSDPDEAIAEAEQAFSLAGRTRPPDAPPLVPEGKTWAGLANLIYFLFSSATPLFRRIPGEFHSADLVREIFGNPFRPVRFSYSWRMGDVMAMARGMYRTNDFGAMPFLADALQDAGCNDADVLNHCRGENAHVRGCWVLDSLLDPADRR